MAVKYGLVACDFDGTLLRSDDTVSPYTREVVAEYVRRGGVFMPTTGRMHISIKQRMADIGFVAQNVPIASYQGALIRENATDKTLHFHPMPVESAANVAREAERLGLYAQAYEGVCGHEKFILSETYGADAYGFFYARRLRVEYVLTPLPLSEYILRNATATPKIVIICPEERRKELIRGFAEKFPETTVNNSDPKMMEVIDGGAGKHKACDIICARLGLTVADCMAIGDSMNDYTMIEHAGLGVAVANADPDVAAIADCMTRSNDEDGVARAIEQFCF
jgi:Cof subfamily protein (haloacid dehalogenase superfamily)